jgi:hypothetical protein
MSEGSFTYAEVDAMIKASQAEAYRYGYDLGYLHGAYNVLTDDDHKEFSNPYEENSNERTSAG